jgi:hypothetical protein
MALRRSYGAPFAGSEFAGYVIRNLGFVGVRQAGASCELQLRPSFASRYALSASAAWLRELAPSRVLLSSFKQDWSHELIPGFDGALRRIDDLVDTHRKERFSRLLRRTVPLDSPHLNADIGQLLHHWGTMTRSEQMTAAQFQLTARLGNRHLLVEADRDTGGMRFVRIGDGLYKAEESWRAQAAGKPVQDQPDPVYGQWLAETYRRVIDTFMPVAEDVDATVEWPTLGRSRLRYKRLIIPFETDTGRIFLLAGALPDTSIDLQSERMLKSA